MIRFVAVCLVLSFAPAADACNRCGIFGARCQVAAVEAVLRELLRDALKLAMRDALRGVITDVARDIVVDVAKTTWITATRPAPAAAGGTVTVRAATGVRPAAGVRRPGVDVWAEATRDEDGRPPRDRAS